MITIDSVPVERNEAKSDNRFCNWSKVGMNRRFSSFYIMLASQPLITGYQFSYNISLHHLTKIFYLLPPILFSFMLKFPGKNRIVTVTIETND